MQRCGETMNSAENALMGKFAGCICTCHSQRHFKTWGFQLNLAAEHHVIRCTSGLLDLTPQPGTTLRKRISSGLTSEVPGAYEEKKVGYGATDLRKGVLPRRSLDLVKRSGKEATVLELGASIEGPNQIVNVRFVSDRQFSSIHQCEQNIRSIHNLYFLSKKSLVCKAGFRLIELNGKCAPHARGFRAIIGVITEQIGNSILMSRLFA